MDMEKSLADVLKGQSNTHPLIEELRGEPV